MPLPLNAWQQRTTNPVVVSEIDRLLDHNTYPQIASLLNDRGFVSGQSKSFTAQNVARVRRRYGLASRDDRLRKAGMLTVDEMAELLEITPQSVKYGIATGCCTVTPITTKTTVCLSIPAITHREKRKV